MDMLLAAIVFAFIMTFMAKKRHNKEDPPTESTYRQAIRSSRGGRDKEEPRRFGYPTFTRAKRKARRRKRVGT